MYDIIKQSINILVLFGLFSSSLVEAAPASTSALGSKSGSQSNSNLICGKTGWNGSQESFLSTSYCNSWAYCQGVCELHSSCQSFAYFNGATGDTGGDCELYSVPVQGNFVADSSSTYKFYDKSCLTAEKKCNVKGYSRIDSFLGIEANSISDCATTCNGYNEYSTGCVSYAFGQGTCLLYSYLVADNVDIDSTSDFIFNDALCGQSTSTVITTTTTTKSVAKTTTSTKVTSSTKASSTVTTPKTMSTTKPSSATKSTTTTKTSSMTKMSTTATSTAVASNLPQCGVAGWYRTDFISEFSVDSLSSCGHSCYGSTGGSSSCLAYAYSNGGDCRLYNSSVADSVWVTSTSEFKNYDLACYSSATTTTATNKAGSTTTMTTALIPTTTGKTTTTKKSSQTITTTSVASAATTSSTAAQCGILGWGRADPIFDFSVDSLSSCADFCYDFSGGSTNCRSYAYSPAAEECRLYNSTVADNVWANSASDYGNYDLACPSAAAASTSTMIMTTTASLSSKTVTATSTKTTNKSSQGVTTTTTSLKKSTPTSSKSTATTTKITTTSSSVATTSPTAQPQCGIVGWGRADPFFDYIGDTLQECAQACSNNQGSPNFCQSYSYGYTSHECRLYSNVSVADNVYVNSGSDFGNYDLPCYNASLNLDPSVCTPGYRGAQCNYKLNGQMEGGGQILNSFDDCVIACNSITSCRYVVWYREAAEGVPQNTCQLLGDPSDGGVALNGVDSASRF